MDTWSIIKWIVGICVSIALIWWLFLSLHVRNLRLFYGRIAMDMNKVKKGEIFKEDTKKERLLKLFFYRQITYEFSAYALLVICIGFLIACIYIFLNAGIYVPTTVNEQKLTTSQYLISIVSVRAGIALVIFFICQVLLKLYRYCLKYTAFYTGLFDALFINDHINKSVEEAVKIFTIPEGVEAAPESPSDKVIEILKQIK